MSDKDNSEPVFFKNNISNFKSCLDFARILPDRAFQFVDTVLRSSSSQTEKTRGLFINPVSGTDKQKQETLPQFEYEKTYLGKSNI